MPTYRVRIFYSYSHKDEHLRDRLETNLAILRRQGQIEEWHDRKISPGALWENEIDKAIDSADVILLLISPDFMASEYCYGKELRRALERHESGKAVLVPIIIRPVEWEDTPFSKYQALPQDGKPVTIWADPDEAWLNITKGLRKIVTEISSKKVVSEPQNYPIQMLDLIMDEFERLSSTEINSGFTTGIPTGFAELDKMIDGIHRTDIIVVAGRASCGKTDLVINISKKLSLMGRVPVLFFTTKLLPERVSRRLMASESRVSVDQILRGNVRKADLERLSKSASLFTEAPLFIQYEPTLTDTYLLNSIEKIQQEFHLGLVVIDGIENFVPTESVGRKHELETYITTAIKLLSRKLSIPLLLTLNPSNENESRLDKRPQIKDFRNWESLVADVANVVILLYRDELYNPDSTNKGIVELIVAKNANGPTGTSKLTYLPQYSLYANLRNIVE